MSFDTYANLQAAIAARMKRGDLAARIPDYIALAETRIKSLMDVRTFEVTIDLATTPSSSTVALPADFKSPIALWLADINPQERIEQFLPESLPYNNTPNRPLYWAIDGTNIRFHCPCNQVYPIKFRYEQVFALSDLIPTNSILQQYPDVYFFGALAEAADDVFDDGNAQKWNAKFMDAVQRANNQEARNNKYVPLATDFGQIMKRRFNVYRGY
jgi:hypothetical protein